MEILRWDGELRTVMVLMMTRLEAEEAITIANMVGMGSGTLDKTEHKRMSRKLLRLARGPIRREKKRLPDDPMELARQMQASGFPVVFQEKLPDGSVREVSLDG